MCGINILPENHIQPIPISRRMPLIHPENRQTTMLRRTRHPKRPLPQQARRTGPAGLPQSLTRTRR